MRKPQLKMIVIMSALFCIGSAFSSYASMDLETGAAVGGITIALNHYYARTMEPEKGLAESVEMVASGTIVLDQEKTQTVTKKLIAEATPQQREIVTEAAVTWGTVVGTDNLRLRNGPSSSAKTLTLLGEGDHYVVVGQEGDFLKVQVDDDLEGYVFKDYIDTSIQYDDEKLSEEEIAKQKAETARLKKEAEEAMKALEEAKKAEESKNDGSKKSDASGKTDASGKSDESKEKKESSKAEESTKGSKAKASETIEGTDAPTRGNTDAIIEAPPIGENGETGMAPTAGEENEAPTADYGEVHEAPPPGGEEETLPKDKTEEEKDEKEETTKASSDGPGGGPGGVSSATRNALVAYAKQFLGNPYIYGGTDLENGTDCSGFTMRIYEHFGYNIGRTSRDQAAKGTSISPSDAQPGDLFFYDSDGYINHVTMYIGNGKVIHASSPTNGIIISSANYRTPCKCCRFIK